MLDHAQSFAQPYAYMKKKCAREQEQMFLNDKAAKLLQLYHIMLGVNKTTYFSHCRPCCMRPCSTKNHFGEWRAEVKAYKLEVDVLSTRRGIQFVMLSGGRMDLAYNMCKKKPFHVHASGAH